MRILLVLACCFGLASFAGAAQPDDENHNQGKKKGGGNAEPQAAAVQTTVTPKVHGQHYNAANFQQPTTVTHYGKNAKKWQGGVNGQTQTNVYGNAASTKFNKGKFSSQTYGTGGTVKFQKKHFNLSNNPSGKYQAVKFNQSYKIAGANKWKGSKYQVFVNYQPQWHDQLVWRSHHKRIVFVFGSPYYWGSGYWSPAWGYDPGANYYY